MPEVQISRNGRAEQQQTPAFNFAAAVVQARKDFPDETNSITFVDLDAPDASRQIRDWAKSLGPETQQAFTANGSFDKITPANSGFMLAARPDNKGILGVHSMGVPSFNLLRDDLAKQSHFIFLHELGHIVVQQSADNSVFDENAADTFALMRGMQMYLFDADDALRVGADRALNWARCMDLTHLSTTSVDRLSLGSIRADFLTLRPRETALIARRHAERFSPDRKAQKVLKNLLGVFDLLPPEAARQEFFISASRVLLATGDLRPEHHAVARMLCCYMNTGIINEAASPDHWERIHKALDAKSPPPKTPSLFKRLCRK